MKKIRFGIVGVGNQGTYYATSLFAKGEIENGVISAGEAYMKANDKTRFIHEMEAEEKAILAAAKNR